MLTFCFCYQQGAKHQLDMKTCVGYVSSIHSVEGVWRYLLIDGCDRIESHAFLVPYYENKTPALVGFAGRKLLLR